MDKTDHKLCMGCMAPATPAGTCPYCGYDPTAPFDPNYIPPGSWLDNRYLVGALSRKNGEGATYMGYDQERKSPVWIREYFPHTIASRNPDTGEVLPSPGRGAQYKALLSDFIELCNEVRRLSVSDPVIPVENMVGENNTIYVIYKHMDVMPLEEYLVAHGGSLSVKDSCDLLIPLLNGVDNIHLRGIIHRGLSPYTVFVSPTDQLYIDAFCLSAARTGGSELQAELFNGYSAPEQYLSTGWQGTWTDVYALATIFYRTISGLVPPKSTQINSQRPLAPLSSIVSGVPKRISQGVEQAMATSAQERTQTVGAFLSSLLAEDGVPHTTVFDPGRIPLLLTQDTPPTPLEEGHTEDLSSPEDLETFRAELRRPPATPSPSKQQPRDYLPEDDYEEYPPPRRNRKNFLLPVVLVAAVILVGGILAIMVNNQMNDSSPSSESSSTTSPSNVSSGNELSDPQSSDSSTSTPLGDNKIPNFVGQKASTVQFHADYKDRYNFLLEEAFDDTIATGLVISQNPPADTLMPNKGTVVLKVSKGPFHVKMPDLSGMEQEAAMQELARLAKTVDLTIEDFTVTVVDRYVVGSRADEIVSTLPRAGDSFSPKNAKIELHIAKARPTSSSTETPSSIPVTPPSVSSVTPPPPSSSSTPSYGDGSEIVDGNPRAPRP